MNCRDCRDRLDEYLDRELSEQEFERVKHHLEDCPPCEDRYQLKQDVKLLVKVCCDQGTAPPALREKLREILF